MKRIINYYIWILLIIFIYSCEQTNEPVNEPKVITAGNTNSSELKEDNQIDKYYYTPIAENYIHIICSSSSNLYLEVKLISPNGDIESSNDLNKVTMFDKHLIVGNRYEIQVRSTNNSRGNYQLLIEVDEDDMREINQSQEYFGLFKYAGEKDYYYTKPSEAGYYHFYQKEYVSSSTSGTPKVEQINISDGTVIHSFWNPVIAAISNVYFSANETKWYRASDNSNAVTNYYVGFMKDYDDDILIEATPYEYQGAIDFIEDRDVLKFKPQTSGSYKFILSERTDPLTYSPDMKIYDIHNSLIGSGNGATNVILTLTLSSNSTYLIDLGAKLDQSSGGYKLNIEKQ